MARRLRPVELPFDSLSLEGTLFVPQLLEEITHRRHRHQSSADYEIPAGLKLTDEIGRAFHIAAALSRDFMANRQREDLDAFKLTRGFAEEFLPQVLGYQDWQKTRGPTVIAERGYPIPYFAAGRVPVVVAPHDLGLDDPHPRFAPEDSGATRKSPHQLLQEFLNASKPCLWGIVTNGRSLRLLRDADTLTRPNYLEFDLDTIFAESRYADFTGLWYLLHGSRAGRAGTPGDQCIWEEWRHDGHELGVQVREGLRHGVTTALQALGTGFLEHRDNVALRQALQSGELSVTEYFEELLRLVYRFLFLFAVEERGYLHPPGEGQAYAESCRLYQQGYSMRRLRDRARRRSAYDRHSDLWDAVRVVFASLREGQPTLALPALGGLFSAANCPHLEAAMLGNKALLTAMRFLRWSDRQQQLAPIDYRNMGPEELGSVYESLLELVPEISVEERDFRFVGLDKDAVAAGNARKTSGSYYTPDELVQHLLDTALDPIIEERIAARPEDPQGALLSITVVDPACGSGHFLLGAAKRLAERLVQLRSVGSATSPDYRHALREVINHCIFGVDRNPMALELARTALWLEGFEPGQPLSFLDHHLRSGDSLLGLSSLRELEAGIPPDAFKAITGDENQVCQRLKKTNNAARKTYRARLADRTIDYLAGNGFEDLFGRLQRIENLPETTTDEIARKETAFASFLQEARESPLAKAADLLVAAFLTPKQDSTERLCPTTAHLLELFYGDSSSSLAEVVEAASTRCRDAAVFHWPLAFPQVFARGGFDCVLGNPPWDVREFQEQEFFEIREPWIARLEGSKRKEAIESLEKSRPKLWSEFEFAKRIVKASNTFAKSSNRFPLTARGKLDTYALFAETNVKLLSNAGRAGFIVPTAVATGDSTKAFFAHLTDTNSLVEIVDFENRHGIFPGVHRSYKFSLLTLGPAEIADLSFYLTDIGQIEDQRRRFQLTPQEFRLINPNTRTCPVFRSQADAELTKKIYRNIPVLIEEDEEGRVVRNAWGVSFKQGLFNMTSASHLFHTSPAAGRLPLYEAKMIHQFDHRWGTYRSRPNGKGPEIADATLSERENQHFEPTPRYWVGERDVLARIADAPRAVCRAFAAGDETALRAAFANWIEACEDDSPLRGMANASSRQRVISAGGRHFEALPSRESDWHHTTTQNEARKHKPLTRDELQILQQSQSLLEAASVILDQRSPRWLMGWRRNARNTDERTLISSLIPRSGVGDSIFLTFLDDDLQIFLSSILNSLTLDYIARQKLGGVNFSFYYLAQLPVLLPSVLNSADQAFLKDILLKLTYTSHSLRPWAEHLGFTGPPFSFDPDRRAHLRAELDAIYARLYGLNREELQFILDPAATHGPDYPTETFRGLKRNEERDFGEYRTQRLVLEAWDRMAP